eukprot:TRINITY_DN1422_c0_g1_i4.p1 TRINITY_DN1422_c0_g1~~TRINITY_DN1422_c0_g1_i4.p1  ORF type:complete len:850 (+),score=133.76 TRINITY_DN1422_c0_g1_i4:302-2551(+)
MKNKIMSYLQFSKQHEDTRLHRMALEIIPVEELRIKAIHNHSRLPNDDDEFMVQLCRWFKSHYFSWVDSPLCNICNGPTKGYGRDYPSIAEKMDRANVVELYKCTLCSRITRFPRYNTVKKLLETRSGRCGEWANCFTMFCRALGYDARYVLDSTDHIWTEVYSHYKQKWIHCDSCEGAYNTPMMYEAGWGKKLSYVLAFSAEEVVDVTKRYTNKWPEVQSRRNLVPEEWLSSIIINFNQSLLNSFNNTRVSKILKRSKNEQIELSSLENKVIKTEEMDGRVSGSMEWRESRGEMGSIPDIGIVFTGNNIVIDIQTFDQETSDMYTLIENAIVGDGILCVTQDKNDQNGACWFNTKLHIDNPFEISFVFRIGPNRGADGFAIVFQDNDTSIIGRGGSDKGYGGIPNSFAIEFDTYLNFQTTEDPNDNHISLHSRGRLPNSAHHKYSLACSSFDLKNFADGNTHSALIKYEQGNLLVYLDDRQNTVIDLDINICELIGSTSAWVGFTAATGGLNQNHQILSVIIGGQPQDKVVIKHECTKYGKSGFKYDTVKNKIMQLNKNVDNSVALSESELFQLRMLLSVFEHGLDENLTIFYVTLYKFLTSWPSCSVFPALDITRLVVLEPSCLDLASIDSLILACLKHINESVPCKLLTLRCLINTLYNGNSIKVINGNIHMIFESIKTTFSAEVPYSLSITCIDFIYNYMITIAGPEHKSICSAGVKLVLFVYLCFKAPNFLDNTKWICIWRCLV